MHVSASSLPAVRTARMSVYFPVACSLQATNLVACGNLVGNKKKHLWETNLHDASVVFKLILHHPSCHFWLIEPWLSVCFTNQCWLPLLSKSNNP